MALHVTHYAFPPVRASPRRQIHRSPDSLVRLPSIDPGLSPFGDGVVRPASAASSGPCSRVSTDFRNLLPAQLLPLRRGSLTDPLLHAHNATPRNAENPESSGGTAELNGRIAAGYPGSSTSGVVGLDGSAALQAYWTANDDIAAVAAMDPENGGWYYPSNGRRSHSNGLLQGNSPPEASTQSQNSGPKRKMLAESHSNPSNTSAYSVNSIDAENYYASTAPMAKRRGSAASNDGTSANTASVQGMSLNDAEMNGHVGDKGANGLSFGKEGGHDSGSSGAGIYAYASDPVYTFPHAPSSAATSSSSAGRYEQPNPTDASEGFENGLAKYAFGGTAGNDSRGPGGYGSPMPRVALSEHNSPNGLHSGLPGSLLGEGQNRANSIFRSTISTNASDDGGSGGDGSMAEMDMAGGGSDSAAGRLRLPLPTKETPYSRSPELRISHKMAERKRRKEMKELFDDLRDSIPAERGIKSSKWEVLSKAIEYIAKVTQERDDAMRQAHEDRSHVAKLEHALHVQLQQQQQQHVHQQQQAPSSDNTVNGQAMPMQAMAGQSGNLHPHLGYSQQQPQWANPSVAYPSMPAHQRSHSHPHPHSMAGGHSANSAPPAMPSLNSHGSHGSSSLGYTSGDPYVRPPSIHSHHSNHSVHSMHSHHSASANDKSPQLHPSQMMSPPPSQSLSQPSQHTGPILDGVYNPFSHIPPLTHGQNGGSVYIRA
ncbi:MAG: hypothetical protein CYPHOPRED_000137 [Cyphobasidiales sp. Tagirdzhanova-0007]|nr:MAG: hypothetical protein CYPHOPRED_000137 [Cyphobasidiales sp. Tagirdzhanova-0007]